MKGKVKRTGDETRENEKRKGGKDEWIKGKQ